MFSFKNVFISEMYFLSLVKISLTTFLKKKLEIKITTTKPVMINPRIGLIVNMMAKTATIVNEFLNKLIRILVNKSEIDVV